MLKKIRASLTGKSGGSYFAPLCCGEKESAKAIRRGAPDSWQNSAPYYIFKVF